MIEDLLYKYVSIYQEAPQPIKLLTGMAYSMLPNQIKYGKEYIKILELLNSNEFSNEEKINSYQFNEIKSVINHAFKNVSYYRDVWKKCGIHPSDIKALSDFRNIPFTEKKIIKAKPRQFLAKNIAKYKILEVATGGSTGTPLPIFYQKGIFRSRELAFMQKQWSRIGYLPGDRIAVLRSATVNAMGKKRLWTFDPTKNRYIFSTFDLSTKNLYCIIDKLNEIKPKFLHVYPSVLTIIANFMREKNISLFGFIKGILSGSENTFPWQINLFKDVFKCKVLRWYGLSEASAIASSCEYSNYYHCFPEYSYVELIDNEGNPVTDEGKVGEIVGTSFTNPAMPLIRYRTGDYAKRGPNSCICGRKHFLLGEIQGREQETIFAKDGSKISLGPVIFGIHDKLWSNITQLQFVQNKNGFLILKIQLLTGIDKKKILEFLKKNVIHKLEPKFSISIVFTDEFDKTPLGKHKFLVSNLISN